MRRVMYRKILAPLDGSELAECILRPVGELVRGCEVENVIFLRVVEPLTMAIHEDAALPPAQLQLLESIQRENARKYLNDVVSRVRYAVTTEVVIGSAAEGIIHYAQNNGVDLIVMATHGRSGISRWVWGSITDKILKTTRVPVLMIRAPGCFPGI